MQVPLHILVIHILVKDRLIPDFSLDYYRIVKIIQSIEYITSQIGFASFDLTESHVTR